MKNGRFANSNRGATMVEIIVAMAILALVAAGIFGAFVFGRQASWRSETEIEISSYTQEIAEQLRSVINAPNAQGLALQPGNIYVQAAPAYDFDGDPAVNGANTPPPLCNNAPIVPIAALNPDQFPARYNVRVAYYVEDDTTQIAPDDGSNPPTCADGARGIDVDGDGATDLHWTKILVEWDSPDSVS